MKTMSEIAIENYRDGYNCAQAIGSPFWEKYGISKADGMRFAKGFGGGIQIGDVCGIISGGVMVIGFKNEEEEYTKLKIQAFIKKLEELKGSIRCRDILGVSPEELDEMTPEEQEKAYDDCEKLMDIGTNLLVEMGY